jgi:hypothetical protein
LVILAVFLLLVTAARADCIDDLMNNIDSCINTWGDGFLGNLCSAFQWIVAIGCIIGSLFS